jgi:hypothetical protein
MCGRCVVRRLGGCMGMWIVPWNVPGSGLLVPVMVISVIPRMWLGGSGRHDGDGLSVSMGVRRAGVVAVGFVPSFLFIIWIIHVLGLVTSSTGICVLCMKAVITGFIGGIGGCARLG